MPKYFTLVSMGVCLVVNAGIAPANAGARATAPAIEMASFDGSTCRKFLPNVGLDMMVPCENENENENESVGSPQVFTSLVTTSNSAGMAPIPRPNRSSGAITRKIHAVSPARCTAILQRMQLDAGRDDDPARLRAGCR